jgi:hypothetical protein
MQVQSELAISKLDLPPMWMMTMALATNLNRKVLQQIPHSDEQEPA